MKEKKLRYIYNHEQSLFYIKQGLEVIQTGVHHKTGNQFWVFLNGVAQTAVFKLWCDKNKC